MINITHTRNSNPLIPEWIEPFTIADYQMAKPNSADGQFIEEEDLKRGSVAFTVYKYFMKSMGKPILLAILICRVLEVLANFGGQFWLAKWSGAGEISNPANNVSLLE